jgi:hypothetical protein
VGGGEAKTWSMTVTLPVSERVINILGGNKWKKFKFKKIIIYSDSVLVVAHTSPQR